MASRDDTRSPDLQKLEEKFRKDPSSKLFFPLAEEYTKAGRVQEAINLLRTGIKAHPDLLSARVALGKALLSKGQTEDAKREFEQVVTANPDNLMAHKKLAGIYFKEGDKRKSLASCEVILAVNPNDPEAVRLRDQIGPLPDVLPEEEATVVAEAPAPGTADAELEPTAVDRAPARDEAVEPTVTLVQPADVEATVVDPTLLSSRNGLAGDSEVVETTDVMALPPATLEPTVPEPVGAASAVEGDAAGKEDEALATMSLADLYVAQGHYQRGIAIYRRLLERTPKDADLVAKLDNALTLERLLAPQTVDAEAVKSEVVQHVLAGTEPAGSESDDQNLQPSWAGVAAESSPHHPAIQRLEVWLARIAERRRR